MSYQLLSNEYAAAPQIQAADVAQLAEAGFAAVICNRPDGEDAGQPSAADIRAACEQHGLQFHHIPVSGNALDADSVGAQKEILAAANGPVLAYCRSGTRSAVIWNVIQRMSQHV